MSKPYIHACSSARRWGGTPEDYIEIHNLLDSSKGAVADSRHRALTHTSWFLSTILERVFGVTLTNSEGKVVSVRDVGEQHVLEDFGGRFIPTAQDYLEGMEFHPWMLNGRNGTPDSYRKLTHPGQAGSSGVGAVDAAISESSLTRLMTGKDVVIRLNDHAFVDGTFGLRDQPANFDEADIFKLRNITPPDTLVD